MKKGEKMEKDVFDFDKKGGKNESNRKKEYKR